jgi:acyl-coenzyme A synthetase/AMP-(fatty) acid ligase
MRSDMTGSVFGSAPLPPCPDDFNMAAHVLFAGKADPDKPALVLLGTTDSRRMSYATLRDRVLGTAGGLTAMGLPPGGPVLLRLGNTEAFPVAFLAAIAAGLLPVPTSAQLTVPEITALARDLAPVLVIAADGVALPEGTACPLLDIAALERLGTNRPIHPVRGSPDRPAYIVYTSGTSGRPRGVIHAHRAVWARRMMIEGWYGLTAADRLMHAGAFNWTYTLGTGLLDPWSVGATALIPAPDVAPEALPELMRQHEVSLFAAAPGIYRRLLRGKMPALPHLRHGLSAGEKLPAALRAAWHEATGTPVHEAFGMSECSTFISGAPARPAPPDMLGYPQPGRRVAILDDSGNPVLQDNPGVIAVAADDPGLMLGYLNAAAETRDRYTPDAAWFLTGDTGAMAADGAVRYLGRSDDMLNAGGVRVSPLEIEAAMLAHPAITEAAATELQVRAETRVIGLFYCAETALPEADLAAFATSRLARYKCPRVFVHLTALPRNANNKLSRRRLRQQWEADHGQA